MNNKINNFINNGYFKFKINRSLFNKNLIILKEIIKRKYKKKFKLENFHQDFDIRNLNDLRLFVFSSINAHKTFKKNFFLSAKENIELLVGSEISCSDMNLSIQMPKDKSSLLEMHSDFFSGESLFQVNLWIPFVNVKKTQSMFIINPKESLKILNKIKNDKKFSFDLIYKKNKKHIKWINVNKGEGILFSPNCLHGNVVNEEKQTRWSINIRYKNLYSPHNNLKNEKELGAFYKPLVVKGASLFNLKYDFNEISKI